MFKVGDKVVYPMHGAGIIESIEEREVLGEIRQYYVMHLPVGNMKLFIPLSNVENLGLRQVISPAMVKDVLEVLRTKDTAATLAWNRRYRANLEKIKSGNIFEVANVVRSLSQRDHEKGLSTGEKKMYENACQILISELVLTEGSEEAAVRQWLSTALV
ncbi:CarD family transcriptional regulator [Desulfosporosinus burensis]|uniref:CarD family transcriptional regulator n=1 Tax=Desulfosporosinus sp. BICA1-9 TaxID=1531958 RepID=UPI00054C33BC|nr:CarD family transcriptional regulator [Desulfosporosinus sp. BICA1-9]KJS49361.1 MAG: CarD family transcriptional regulator [Peptococcaceae bacterium BRH_c23]KJS90279.1 MAG: CarD family transcriptional regulator [Desulfosporosinus sp. BICA1-9]HBW37935.1 CarD family transcriptional regulator [Desulfosporosinus sp.]